MAKKMTVNDWLSVILPAEEKIDTVVRYGPDIVCRAESPSWLSSHGALGVLEARVMGVEITKARITIQAKPKDITV